jgi:hypothetical protein
LTKLTETDEQNYPWFNQGEYGLQRCLGATDWALMLQIRVSLRERYQSEVASRLDKAGRKQFWEVYCKSVSLRKYLKQKQEGTTPALPWAAPAFAEVTSELLIPQHRERIITWMVAMSGCRVLQINPWASYDTLKKRFDQWLRELRKEFQPPFKRRGRPGANIQVTKLHFQSWADHSILGVFDLDFHSEVFGKRPLSRSALHKIINPNSPDAIEWAKRARKLVQQAVDGLEYLIVEARIRG